MNRGNLYVVSAPSGGGKTSLTRALVPRLAQRGIAAAISVSYTTRAPRPGEQEGVHYHFVSEPAFQKMAAADEFFEHAQVFDRHYGTGRAKTEALLGAGQDVILDIDWQGGRQVKARTPAATGIFILPPSREELEKRLRGRGQDSAEVIARRMRQAHEEMSHYKEYDHLLINQDFEQALEDLLSIFVAGRLRLDAQAGRYKSLIEKLLSVDGAIR